MADPRKDPIVQLGDLITARFPTGNALITDPDSWHEPPSDKPLDFQLGWWAALTMIAQTGTSGLTDAEHAIASKVGDLAGDFMDLVGDGPTAPDDFNEILPHLHALQQAVMAQAAARAHPGRYRTLGGVIDGE